jgi:hypothetical protein
MLALVGCEKQNQSSLDFADVTMTATVSGKLVFFANQAGTPTVEVPVADQRVYFLVAAGKYATGADGNQKFEAKTDAEGNFAISVPCGSKNIAGDLMTDIIKIEYNEKTYYLKETKNALALNAGDNKVNKVIAPIDNILTECQGKCVVKGKVTYNAGIVEKNGVKEDGEVAAPAGVKVTVKVTYDDAEKALITATKADGTYELEVPVPTDKALNATISLAEFEGVFTEMFNNKLLSKPAIYGLNTPIPTTVGDGETKVNDIVADRILTEEPTTMNTTLKVKGTIQVACEKLKYQKGDNMGNVIAGVEDNSTARKPYTYNGGKFQLEVRHMQRQTPPAKDILLGKIIYNVTANEQGKYETEVKMYDTWKYDDVDLVAVIDKFVVEDYMHYCNILGYYDGDIWKNWAKKWSDAANNDEAIEKNHANSQACSGYYELESAAVVPDGIFASQVDGAAKFTMSPESKSVLRGVGNDVDTDKNGNKVYSDGIPY